jgi:fumarate reductase subunit D
VTKGLTPLHSFDLDFRAVFASAGAFAMIITSHSRRLYDVALASAAGQVSQVPFVVLPVAMLLLAVLAALGVIPTAASGAVLPIDLETTSVVILAFPPMLLLWKAIQDDGKVNIVETAAMVCVFGIVVYLLAVHG